LPTLLATVRRGSAGRASRERSFAIDPAQTKVEMLRITREVGVDDWITRDVLLDRTPEPPVGTVGAMKIGIRWQRDLDIDLYARARPEAETLFFEHTRCPEGYYFKDHRSSPDREYEFIEFERPVNIWEVVAQINFYEGRAPGGATGEIRIEFDRTIYSGTFALQAEHGNRGRSGRTQFRYWTEIDVPGILGLRGSERHASRR
jgi:hypothetical protein